MCVCVCVCVCVRVVVVMGLWCICTFDLKFDSRSTLLFHTGLISNLILGLRHRNMQQEIVAPLQWHRLILKDKVFSKYNFVFVYSWKCWSPCHFSDILGTYQSNTNFVLFTCPCNGYAEMRDIKVLEFGAHYNRGFTFIIHGGGNVDSWRKEIRYVYA